MRKIFAFLFPTLLRWAWEKAQDSCVFIISDWWQTCT